MLTIPPPYLLSFHILLSVWLLFLPQDTVNALSDFLGFFHFGPMSILWTKRVERLCCFFQFLILLLLWCQITNRAMYPLTIIPAFYVFKDRPPGLLEILISMQIDFFLFQYRMEGFYTCIVIWISLTAE